MRVGVARKFGGGRKGWSRWRQLLVEPGSGAPDLARHIDDSGDVSGRTRSLLLATATPGLKDLLVLGKLKQVEVARHHDLVVVDAEEEFDWATVPSKSIRVESISVRATPEDSRGQLPLNTGSRRSMNERTPSTPSSETNRLSMVSDVKSTTLERLFSSFM